MTSQLQVPTLDELLAYKPRSLARINVEVGQTLLSFVRSTYQLSEVVQQIDVAIVHVVHNLFLWQLMPVAATGTAVEKAASRIEDIAAKIKAAATEPTLLLLADALEQFGKAAYQNIANPHPVGAPAKAAFASYRAIAKAIEGPNPPIDPNVPQYATDAERLRTEGVESWNEWRRKNPDILPNLQDSYLSRIDLGGVNFEHVNLSLADLSDSNLWGANFGNAILRKANLRKAVMVSAHVSSADLSGSNLTDCSLSAAQLIGTNLTDCILEGASLSDADLTAANLTGADLNRCNLERAILIRTTLDRANLTNCRVYGAATWDISLHETVQNDLIISQANGPTITVDNLEVAQFLHLLLDNERIRHVIDAITSKVVLILGRFSKERKAILDAMREALRSFDYLPILFDFERPSSRDFTETIQTLVGLSRFVIIDITDPKSVPAELQATVPNFMVPFLPLIQQDETPFSLFSDLQLKYDWVLDLLAYKTPKQLIVNFRNAVIDRAEAKCLELRERRATHSTRVVRRVDEDR